MSKNNRSRQLILHFNFTNPKSLGFGPKAKVGSHETMLNKSFEMTQGGHSSFVGPVVGKTVGAGI
jgi:hypothetical protein